MEHSSSSEIISQHDIPYHSSMRAALGAVDKFEMRPNNGHAVSVRLTDTNLVLKRMRKPPWYKSQLFHTQRLPNELEISLDDIFAVGTAGKNEGKSFQICWVSRTTSYFGLRTSSAANVRRMTLLCESQSQRDRWVRWIRQRTIQWTEDNPARVLVVINPHAGVKKGRQVVREKCTPVFDMAHEVMPDLFNAWDKRETKRAGHAIEIVKGTDLRRVNCIVSCGGDGILHECVTGLLQHGDFHQVCQKVSMALIPAGTSNALSKTIMNSRDMVYASALVTKGFSQPLDIISTFIKGKRGIIVASSHYGLFATISMLSDRYRSLSKYGIGYSRYFLAAVQAINNRQYFAAKLQFVKANNDTLQEQQNRLQESLMQEQHLLRSIETIDHDNVKDQTENYHLMNGPPCPLLDLYFPGYLNGDDQADRWALENNRERQQNIEALDGNLLLIMISNTPHFDKSLSIDRDSIDSMPSSGTIKLSYIHDRISRSQIYYGLYRSARKGELSWDDLSIEHRMARAFKITPLSGDSHQQENSRQVNALHAHIDGEPVDTEYPMYGEVHPQLCRIITLPYKSNNSLC